MGLWRRSRHRMQPEQNKKSLYKGSDESSWQALKTELLQCELLSPSDIDPRDIQFERRATVYRLMLVFMLFAVSVISIESLFLTSNFLVAGTGLTTCCACGATLIHLIKTQKILIPALVNLTLTAATVLATIANGAEHHTLWLFPLMIAIAGLLPTVIALATGVGVIAVLFAVSNIDFSASTLAIHAAMIATWLLSLAVMRLLTLQSEELADLALSDPLTGAYNRRYLSPQCGRSIADYNRYRRLTSMLMIDIDHFKKINDTYGHLVGDLVLIELVKLIEDRIRGIDMVFRLGGEEFIVLLSDAGAHSAAKVGEELRFSISQLKILPNNESLTVSIGVCDVTVAESPANWLELVDQCMYEAKQAGRDQVKVVPSRVPDNSDNVTSIPVWR